MVMALACSNLQPHNNVSSVVEVLNVTLSAILKLAITYSVMTRFFQPLHVMYTNTIYFVCEMFLKLKS